jgi:BolA family transcriptional regulator, general stress-responsive regulator
MNNKEKTVSIEKLLKEKLAPSQLNIIDDSAKHIGHAGEGKGHFTVEIASNQFENKSLIQCHRLVYQALDSMMEKHIHALCIRVLE